MDTQLHFGVRLKPDTPAEVIEILKYMLGELPEEPSVLPNHALFSTSRWSHMLQCDGYYFDYKTVSLLTFDEIADEWFFNVTTNLKNYDNEIAAFLDWISPYVTNEPCEFSYKTLWQQEQARAARLKDERDFAQRRYEQLRQVLARHAERHVVPDMQAMPPSGADIRLNELAYVAYESWLSALQRYGPNEGIFAPTHLMFRNRRVVNRDAR